MKTEQEIKKIIENIYRAFENEDIDKLKSSISENLFNGVYHYGIGHRTFVEAFDTSLVEIYPSKSESESFKLDPQLLQILQAKVEQRIRDIDGNDMKRHRVINRLTFADVVDDVRNYLSDLRYPRKPELLPEIKKHIEGALEGFKSQGKSVDGFDKYYETTGTIPCQDPVKKISKDRMEEIVSENPDFLTQYFKDLATLSKEAFKEKYAGYPNLRIKYITCYNDGLRAVKNALRKNFGLLLSSENEIWDPKVHQAKMIGKETIQPSKFFKKFKRSMAGIYNSTLIFLDKAGNYDIGSASVQKLKRAGRSWYAMANYDIGSPTVNVISRPNATLNGKALELFSLPSNKGQQSSITQQGTTLPAKNAVPLPSKRRRHTIRS